MKCPRCIEESQKSKVYVGISTSTLLHSPPFYDEEGRFHYHDPNTTTTHYSCSNDHDWQESACNKCWCEDETPD